jgi:hypothetical protein
MGCDHRAEAPRVRTRKIDKGFRPRLQASPSDVVSKLRSVAQIKVYGPALQKEAKLGQPFVVPPERSKVGQSPVV